MSDDVVQRGLLASHQAQLAGAEQTIDGLFAEKLNGLSSRSDEEIDAEIARWQIESDRQQQCIDNCLRNLGELPAAAEVIAETTVPDIYPPVDPAPAPKRGRKAAAEEPADGTAQG